MSISKAGRNSSHMLFDSDRDDETIGATPLQSVMKKDKPSKMKI